MTEQQRTTKQKEAIKAVLATQEGPLLPEEIHRFAIKIVPSLGIATVYRSLKSLQNAGLVCTVEIPGQPPRYETANRGHHHHFHCQHCHVVFDLGKCVEGINHLVPQNFRITDHDIILYGFCNSCS